MSIEEQRAAVIKEALSWRGTPFRDSARVKGPRGGVDCGQFLCAVYETVGVTPPIETPKYNLQFMLNCSEELYIAQLLKYSSEIEFDEALPGDVYSLHWGLCYSHSGILLEPWCGKVIHATNPFGVVVNDASRDGRIRATLRRFRAYPPRFFRPLAW